MNDKIIIEVKLDHLKDLMLQALKEYSVPKTNPGVKTYTVNQVAKLLGMSHHYVKKLIESGVMRSTKSGRITETAVEEYLGNKG